MQETNLDQIMHRQCHRLTIFLYLIWQIVTQSGTIVRRAGLSNYALHCFCDVKVHFTEISWHRNVNIFFCIFYLPKTSLQSKAFNNQEVNISSWYRPSALHALILLVKTKSTKKRLKIWGTWKNDKLKVHDTWQGPPSRLFSQPECLDVYFIAGG